VLAVPAEGAGVRGAPRAGRQEFRPRKALARSPLPPQLREDVIELLASLLLAEVMRHPDAYRAGPEGGPTVTVQTGRP
jgi:hypothetical protein